MSGHRSSILSLKQPQRLGSSLGIVLVLSLLFSARSRSNSDEAPLWLKQAAAHSKLPDYGPRVNAVVLWDESTVSVGEDARIVSSRRRAVKLLSREGRSEALARVFYSTDTLKVRELKAWLIRPSGEVRRYGKEKVLDIAAVDNDVYNEFRVQVVDASEDAEAGATFGFESAVEDRTVFSQFDWSFQTTLPARLSRLKLDLPSDWRAESVTFNHAQIEPVVSGKAYVWELRDLPPIDPEPLRPTWSSLVPRLGVTIFPPGGTKSGARRAFVDWSEVSIWLTELSHGQDVANAALVAKVKELVAGIKSEYEKIRAIARYVQQINYISVQTGVGRGGGYRPHTAVDVFAKSYGDCKDKANLMRTMLREAGIQAFLLVIYSGDPNFVRPEWPSPQQFNHCIVAIRIGDQTDSPVITKHPQLGRLMVFDPTDPYTPLGDLPQHQQGSLALLIAGDAGTLLRMPETGPLANRQERHITAVIGANGELVAKVKESSVGHSAVAERTLFRRLSQPDYNKVIERWVTLSANAASLARISPVDHPLEGRFDLELEFAAPNYGQLMQGRLLVFNPAILARRTGVALTEPSRKYPIVLEDESFHEVVTIDLPDGFQVDEYPEPLTLDESFGSFATKCEVTGRQLVFIRTLKQKAGTLPPDQYANVKSFFGLISGSSQAPVVLIRR